MWKAVIFAAILLLAVTLAFLLVPPFPTPSAPDSAATKLTEDAIRSAKIMPLEKPRLNLRDVGGDEIASVPEDGGLIERLPARPVPPKPPQPEKPVLPPVPVQIALPKIDAPGMLRGEDYLIRLSGIRSPALDLECDGNPCGRQARTALRRFIRGRTIICILPREPQKEVIAAQCTVGGKDIADWLVAQGWAVAETGSDYENVMEAAKAKKSGLWRGSNDAVVELGEATAERD